MTIFDDLAAEFPRSQVSWRAQSMNTKGDSALALAYIDARDVMDRLDEVVGPENWQDSYVETATGRVICTIAIRIGDGWVSKSDGAGKTDVEGDKGGISDAFKRAAVKWGVGRYLYNLESPWVPCESTERNGKRFWKRWTADPWTKVRNAGTPPAAKPPASVISFCDALAKATDPAAYWLAHFKAVPKDWQQHCIDFKETLKAKEAA